MSWFTGSEPNPEDRSNNSARKQAIPPEKDDQPKPERPASQSTEPTNSDPPPVAPEPTVQSEPMEEQSDEPAKPRFQLLRISDDTPTRLRILVLAKPPGNVPPTEEDLRAYCEDDQLTKRTATKDFDIHFYLPTMNTDGPYWASASKRDGQVIDVRFFDSRIPEEFQLYETENEE